MSYVFFWSLVVLPLFLFFDFYGFLYWVSMNLPNGSMDFLGG